MRLDPADGDFMATSTQFDSASVARALASCGLIEYVVVETTNPLGLLDDLITDGLAVIAYQCDQCSPEPVRVNESANVEPGHEKLPERYDYCRFTLASMGLNGVSGHAAFTCDELAKSTSSLSACPMCPIAADRILASPVTYFSETPADVLIAGRFLILKSIVSSLPGDASSLSLSGLLIEVHDVDGMSLTIPSENLSSAISGLRSATRRPVFLRTELPLFGEYLGWLRDGRKVTTVRLRPGAVELVASARLPLFETTSDFNVYDRSKQAGYVTVSAIRYCRFQDLSSTDADRDGFQSVDEMRQTLRLIYPSLRDGDWLTIYDIRAD